MILINLLQNNFVFAMKHFIETPKNITMEKDEMFTNLFHKNIEGETLPVTLDAIELFVSIRAGDELDRDVTCDSAFMLEEMPKVGKALRERFHWVLQKEKIFWLWTMQVDTGQR